MHGLHGSTHDGEVMNTQLVLTDETLRAAVAVLPYGRIATELARARDIASGGHLTTCEVRDLVRALNAAASDPATLVTATALRLAGGELRRALASLDLDGLELAHVRTVSVFVWDPERDGPVPAWLARSAEL